MGQRVGKRLQFPDGRAELRSPVGDRLLHRAGVAEQPGLRFPQILLRPFALADLDLQTGVRLFRRHPEFVLVQAGDEQRFVHRRDIALKVGGTRRRFGRWFRAHDGFYSNALGSGAASLPPVCTGSPLVSRA